MEHYSGCRSPCATLGDHYFSSQSDPPLSGCFSCKGNYLEADRQYKYCPTCKLEYHFECYKYAPEIRHPFHLSHPLNSNLDDGVSISEGSYGKCNCCRKRLSEVYYHCSICDYSINATCARHAITLTMANLKRHEHALNLFPGRLPLPCNACGLSLDKIKDHAYTCFPCSYMVHRKCIDLPRVIKITRHAHRLSYSSSLPSGEFLCGVCRQTVDVSYGQYSCSKGCHYAVHSKCATRKDVWDGKDLEGVPEEPDEVIEPFEQIDEETIQHFTHEHYLKLQRDDCPRDQDYKFCQACNLAITNSDGFYSCSSMQCDFILHETCASLPIKKHHPLHKHPLTLFQPFPPKPHHQWFEMFPKGIFACNGCNRGSCGFVYKCFEDECEFQLDVRCASLPDPLIHGSHPHDHPLYFNLTKDKCMACGDGECGEYALECIKCKLFLGLYCATIPWVAHYKYDKHQLILRYGEEETTSLNYWCEKCETKLDAKTWFYACDDCNVTLHRECLLGASVYMKPNHNIRAWGAEAEITRNNGNSRPLCDGCGILCVDTLVYKAEVGYCCSFRCVKLSSDRKMLWS
ncbi:hypothetical protein EUTSA_v10000551mg [Eutrema salsugineum]|uniref:Phorbol-ester/DAG-type domain-containing protein n=1 Tax=Eutrema salsugineum TaxID=72664 RepID=V4M1R4_EUTSA|nr:hypothetical protein EUTSA_v10000551mg [Eutrema salsugineum]